MNKKRKMIIFNKKKVLMIHKTHLGQEGAQYQQIMNLTSNQLFLKSDINGHMAKKDQCIYLIILAVHISILKTKINKVLKLN